MGEVQRQETTAGPPAPPPTEERSDRLERLSWLQADLDPARSAVVVGVDGSQQSQRALDWACRYAHDRGRDVLAVAVRPRILLPDDLLIGDVSGGAGGDGDLDGDPGVDAPLRAMVDDMAESAVSRRPGVTVLRQVVHGHPARVLVDLACDTDLLVVGARGHGALSGLLMGSVSQSVVARCPCSVVVVR